MAVSRMITRASKRKDGELVGVYKSFDEARNDVADKIPKGYIWDIKKVDEDYYLYKAIKR